MSRTPGKTILLSAGGTGGHMTPAQALAHDLTARGFSVELVTDTRGMKYHGMFGGIPAHVLRSGTTGPGLSGKISGVLHTLFGVAQAVRLIRKKKPAVVVGFGGYPSFPAVCAAQILGVPTIVHEQNAVLGRANEMLIGKAARIALSLPLVRPVEEKFGPRCAVTGNPVRPDIAALYTQPYPALSDKSPLNILIMGGSLGAKVFSDVIPAVLAQLSPEQKSRLRIVQQCREGDIENVRALYAREGIAAELSTFFGDVAQRLREAHLVIARSGASTVAEVTAAGRPAIFVPYPHHKDQQQKMNAEAVADAGGAWLMMEDGFTQNALLTRMETFMQAPESLFAAAEKSRSCGRPDAARNLGNLVTEVASGWNK